MAAFESALPPSGARAYPQKPATGGQLGSKTRSGADELVLWYARSSVGSSQWDFIVPPIMVARYSVEQEGVRNARREHNVNEVFWAGAKSMYTESHSVQLIVSLKTALYGLGNLEKTGGRRLYFGPKPKTSSNAVLLSQLGTVGILSCG